MADRLGSLEVGKNATLILTDGDPLEIRTNVRRIFISGEETPMDSRHTLLYEKFRRRLDKEVNRNKYGDIVSRQRIDAPGTLRSGDKR